jgi:glucokinase
VTVNVARIGIDVGGTKCLGVVLDGEHTVIDTVRRPTPSARDLVDVLCDIVNELRGEVPFSQSVSVGVGVPGLVTFDGTFRASPHIAGVVDIPVATLMTEQLNTAVRVDNDATAATYAEWKIGAACNATDAIVVTLGTGIGGGIISGGQLQRGAHGHAGEFGHMVVNVEGDECVCGQRGCWELYASGSALRTLSGGLEGEEVMNRAAGGDQDAIAVVHVFSQWVAQGLAGLVNVLDPEVVVIGGGVVRAGDLFLDHVEHYLATYAYGARTRDLPTIVPAQLGDHAGAIGSALLGALQ